MQEKENKVPIVFHEKVKKQRKSRNGDIVITETKPAPINTWGFGYKLNEEDDNASALDDIIIAYMQEKTNDIDTDLVADDPGNYDAGYHDGYISAMEYIFKCLGIEVNKF